MKRITIIMIVLVGSAAALLISARTQAPGRSSQASRPESQAAQQQMALEKTITTQQRLNRYFHGDVIPKLKTCWSGIQGKGTVGLKYTYTKAATGKWVFEKLEVNGSTLPRGQDAAALKCMQDSVRGTSFPVEGNDTSEKAFVLNWTWPVPFPKDADEQTRVMFAEKGKGGGGTGGCDGRGTVAQCTYCNGKVDTPKGNNCDIVCVGNVACVIMNGVCTGAGKCASGGPFGVAGGGVFAQ